MLPAFRCFGYSNITLAKSGNATIKHHTQLWLLGAAQDDMSTMLTQITEFLSFLASVILPVAKNPVS